MKGRRSLRDVAEMVRKQGTEGDTILAHINPDEARLLGRNFGGSINPVTGLPEYGFFRKLLPIIGSMVGSWFGGPVGGAIGGSIGGALSGGRDSKGKVNVGKNALKGAAISVPVSFGMHHMGIGPTSAAAGHSWLGNVTNSLGVGNIMNGMRNPVLGAATNMPTQLMPSMPSFGQGAMQQQMSYEPPSMMQALMGDPLRTALLATSIGGTLMRRERPGQETGPTMHEMMQRSQAQQGGPARRAKPLRRRSIHAPEEHRPGIDPEHIFFDEVNPETEYYASGGYVHDREGGQADNVRIKIPPKSFVMDATTVSLIGDGNSANGAKKLKEMEDSFMKSGIVRQADPYPGRHINAFVSGGEYIVKPHSVTAIGKGNNERGAKKLDQMRQQLRKEKGVSKFLPPKTKKLANYIR